jgi:hypothetical protein
MMFAEASPVNWRGAVVEVEPPAWLTSWGEVAEGEVAAGEMATGEVAAGEVVAGEVASEAVLDGIPQTKPGVVVGATQGDELVTWEDTPLAEEVALVSVAVTGQTVVYRLMMSVVTLPIRAGQLVTVDAQDVIVYTCVVYTVDVVHDFELCDSEMCEMELLLTRPQLVEFDEVGEVGLDGPELVLSQDISKCHSKSPVFQEICKI